jgi:hypothetical protein
MAPKITGTSTTEAKQAISGTSGKAAAAARTSAKASRPISRDNNITDINTSFMDASNSSYVSIRDAINSRDTFNSRDHKKSLISSCRNIRSLMLTVRKPKSDSCIRPLFFFFILSPTPIAIRIYPYDFYRKVPNSAKSRMGQVQVAVEVLHIAPHHLIIPRCFPFRCLKTTFALVLLLFISPASHQQAETRGSGLEGK